MGNKILFSYHYFFFPMPILIVLYVYFKRLILAFIPPATCFRSLERQTVVSTLKMKCHPGPSVTSAFLFFFILFSSVLSILFCSILFQSKLSLTLETEITINKKHFLKKSSDLLYYYDPT